MAGKHILLPIGMQTAPLCIQRVTLKLGENPGHNISIFSTLSFRTVK